MQKYIIQNALEEITGGTTLYTLEKHSKKPIISTLSGRSSGVERNLAKVEVEGSNPFARSKKIEQFHFNKSINKIIDNTINKQPTIFCIK
jgi:hypothetical protein